MYSKILFTIAINCTCTEAPFSLITFTLNLLEEVNLKFIKDSLPQLNSTPLSEN